MDIRNQSAKEIAQQAWASEEMMMRALALFLGRHAARVLHPVRPTHALAMYAELEHLEGARALFWALGCLAASYRMRASCLAVMIVGARMSVAAAAGLFGLVHVIGGAKTLWAKILIITGGSIELYPVELIHFVESQTLGHWLWIFLAFATLGVLHLVAAMMLALGRHDWVLRLAIVAVGVDLIMPFAGMGGFALPAVYIGLATLMALASTGFAWLWRWDEHRSARS